MILIFFGRVGYTMVLTPKQCQEIKEALDKSVRPLFIHDDDPDGTCAFLLLYRYKKEGKGFPLKTRPLVDEGMLTYVHEYQPDLIFILDIPNVLQGFLDKVSCPVIWIDHHGVQDRKGVWYYNPRKNDPEDTSSTTINTFYVVQNPDDLWIAMVGGVGDWQLPPFLPEFCTQYPKLLKATVKRPQDALFGSRLGELIKLISFLLKGRTSDVKRNIKILTRIKDPYEILEGTTSQGRFLLKNAMHAKKEYDVLLAEAKKKAGRDKFFIFTYSADRTSYTKELSNELLYLYPSKIIIVGRVKSEEYKLSLRSSKKKIPPALEKALTGVEGYGGGHDLACGAAIKEKDWEVFLAQFKEAMA